jgi:biotin carboxylase
VAVEARAAGAPVPDTAVITDPSALAGWSYPLVLKTDGSWGGRGVAIVRDESRLPRAWSTMSSRPSFSRVLKRAVVNRDVDGLVARLRGRRPVVNAQQFVDGREAIVTVACLDGKVRDLVCMEVVQSSAVRGPATVIRVIDHPEMAEAARRLVERFGLSGFCGLDFMLTADDQPFLVEMNPRVTPTCHLLVEGRRYEGRTLTLFPPEGPADLVDTPVRAHALVELGAEMTARRLDLLTRLGRRLTQRLNAPRF